MCFSVLRKITSCLLFEHASCEPAVGWLWVLCESTPTSHRTVCDARKHEHVKARAISTPATWCQEKESSAQERTEPTHHMVNVYCVHDGKWDWRCRAEDGIVAVDVAVNSVYRVQDDCGHGLPMLVHVGVK
jgi:hypothetical protein